MCKKLTTFVIDFVARATDVHPKMSTKNGEKLRKRKSLKINEAFSQVNTYCDQPVLYYSVQKLVEQIVKVDYSHQCSL